ncbi:MAG TPA: hypothetical protein VM889_06610 [Candidatus Thermoplasmatota archaeon]|nr:hypothetical protein [Candidatus Thermoplasmatota archaeon]
MPPPNAASAGRLMLPALVCFVMGPAVMYAGHSVGDTFALAGYATGSVIVLMGLVLMAKSLKPPPPPAKVVRADLAFEKSNTHEIPVPNTKGRGRVLKKGQRQEGFVALSENDMEIHRLEETIRDLNKKISRASVMLGTGKLSPEGYARYVDDLKKKRGELEAEKTRRQFVKP